MWSPVQNLGPIGSAVLAIIGYKKTDRQAKYIYRWYDVLFTIFFTDHIITHLHLYVKIVSLKKILVSLNIFWASPL